MFQQADTTCSQSVTPLSRDQNEQFQDEYLCTGAGLLKRLMRLCLLTVPKRVSVSASCGSSD